MEMSLLITMSKHSISYSGDLYSGQTLLEAAITRVTGPLTNKSVVHVESDVLDPLHAHTSVHIDPVRVESEGGSGKCTIVESCALCCRSTTHATAPATSRQGLQACNHNEYLVELPAQQKAEYKHTRARGHITDHPRFARTCD
jgi:hypothetical protein